MTKTQYFAAFAIFALMEAARAQEAPAPTISPTPEEHSASPSPTLSSARSVRISFVPPPLEGTISLGVYDTAGRLVRVLHQQASVDVFTIGADALVTKWDGKDDDGQDVPPGKYQAHGFAVGAIQVENIPANPAQTPPPAPEPSITVKLVENPLVKNERPTVALTVGFDDTDSFLKTNDELPLYIISEQPGVSRIVAARAGDKSIDVWQDSASGSEHLRVSKLDQMMAFDCGTFELK